MALVFRLHCSASSPIWTRMHQFDCSPAQHTTRLRRKVRKQLEMSEDDEDRAEPFVRTKTGTSSERSKTGRWRKVGLVAAKVAVKVGQEATMFDD